MKVLEDDFEMNSRIQEWVSKLRNAAPFHNDILGEPTVTEGESALVLYFNTDAIQGVMLKNAPEFLVLGYTRTMMGFLFFVPEPRHIAMIGLGSGALAKYCYKFLPQSQFTAIEVNPRVIALRNTFNIPKDDGRFKVICANGCDFVRRDDEKVDVLLIDGFKLHGQPISLVSPEFYDNCHAKLNEGGLLVINFLNDTPYNQYVSRIEKSFNKKVLLIDSETPGNKIAFVGKGDNFPPAPASLQDLLPTLNPHHNLPLQSIALKLTEALK